MTTTNVSAGFAADPHASSPDLSYAAAARFAIAVQKDAAVGAVWLPVDAAMDADTVVSASLVLTRRGGSALTPTVAVQPFAAAFVPSTTWTGLPTVTGSAVTDSHASPGDLDTFTFDLTSAVTGWLAGADNFGVRVSVTDIADAVQFYGFGTDHPPQLVIVAANAPAVPSNLRPSAGRAVATPTPTVRWDGDADVLSVQVQVAVDGDFGSPDFDSGTVAATACELDLSATAFAGLTASTRPQWRARYTGSAGVWSAWSDAAHVQYVVPGVLTVGGPVAGGSSSPVVYTTDTPTLPWNFSDGGAVQTAWHLWVTFADDPTAILFDTGWRTGDDDALTLPEGVVRDSSVLVQHVEVADDVAREAVPGFGATYSGSRQFTFQPTITVPPPDFLTATQVGTSNAVDFTWSYSAGTVDTFRLNIDGLNVAGASELGDLQPDGDGNYHYRYYAATPNEAHLAEILAKKDDQVSSNNPRQSFACLATGKWLHDPNESESVLLHDTDSGGGTLGEITSVYAPLRGQNSIVLTQGQRGYEDTLTGFVIDDETNTARQAYRAMVAMRTTPNPEKPYIIAYPYMAFEAALRNWKLPNLDDAGRERWGVSVDYFQQGDLLWLGREAVDPSLTLLHTLDFEGWGSDGATITTGMSSDLDDVHGNPTLSAAEALHGSTMGMYTPDAANGGWVMVPGTYVGTAQGYVTPRSVSSKSPLFFVNSVAGEGFTCFTVNLRTAGDIDILDSDGTFVAKTTAAEYTMGQPFRVVVQWAWDPVALTCSVVVYVFVGANMEGLTPDDQFGGSFGCAQAPAFPAVGHPQPGAAVGYDDWTVYSGNSTMPAPKGSLPAGGGTVTYAIAGDQTDTSFTVAATVTGFDDPAALKLAVGTSVDSSGNPVSPVYVSPSVTYDSGDNGTVVKFSVTGKTKSTLYYCKVSDGAGAFFGTMPTTAKTFPAVADFASGTKTLKVSFGSCQRNARTVQAQLAWEDMVSWGYDWGIHVGDIHYQGAKFTTSSTWMDHHAVIIDQIANIATMRKAFQAACWDFQGDDHDFSGNNGESNIDDPDGHGIIRRQLIQGAQRFFPQTPSLAPGAMDDKHGLWYFKDWGPHVRFWFVDNESLDRDLSPSGSGDDVYPGKSFLGDPQYEDWLKPGLLASTARVNVLVQGKSFMGGQYNSTTTDKPEGYQAWRSDLCDFLAGNVDGNGRTLEDTVVWLGGDIHANVYMSAADNPFGNFVLLGGSGYDMHSKGFDTGVPGLPGSGEADYTEFDGFSPPGLGEVDNQQYLQVTLTDNATTSTVNFHVQSRTCGTSTYDPGTGDPTDPSTWAIGNGWSVDIPFGY